MINVVGVYNSGSDAEQGVFELRRTGIRTENINILAPGSHKEDSVPTMAGEQPGIVKAIGSAVGGAAGLGLGEGLATLLVPGVGPVLAIGMAGGALLGALAGSGLGSAAEKNSSPEFRRRNCSSTRTPSVRAEP
jgi:hypothetical protein